MLVFFVSFTVKVLAKVSKTTEGRTSTWSFCQEGDNFFALRLPQVKAKQCKDLEDLRSLYKVYTTNKTYGFEPVAV